MTSEDFVKIFYSNFSPNIDWANIDEVCWMYQEGMFSVVPEVIASNSEFIKREVKVFVFEAKPKFFEYIKHKQKLLNEQRSKFR